MTEHNNTMEQLFRDRLAEFAPAPSREVWQSINRRLWVRDMVRPSLRKFNVYYLLLLLGSAGLLAGLLNRPAAEATLASVPVEQGAKAPAVSQQQTDAKPTAALKPDVKAPQKTAPAARALRARFSTGAASFCVPAIVQFSNLSEGASTYSWQFGDGTSSAEAQPAHTFNTAGRYLISLTITDASGKTDVAKQTIDVAQAPQARFKIDVNGSSKAQKIIQFTNLSEGAGSYRWDFGDAQQSTETNPRHLYAKNGTYKIRLTAKGTNRCADSMVLATKYLEMECGLLFPNVFYPSIEGPASAGSNRMQKSIFLPEYQGVADYKLSVFDKYGRLVFETTRLDFGWNGYVERRLVPAGNYKWQAVGKYANDEAFDIEGEVKVVYDQTYNAPLF